MMVKRITNQCFITSILIEDRRDTRLLPKENRSYDLFIIGGHNFDEVEHCTHCILYTSLRNNKPI